MSDAVKQYQKYRSDDEEKFHALLKKIDAELALDATEDSSYTKLGKVVLGKLVNQVRYFLKIFFYISFLGN